MFLFPDGDFHLGQWMKRELRKGHSVDVSSVLTFEGIDVPDAVKSLIRQMLHPDSKRINMKQVCDIIKGIIKGKVV